MAITTIQTPTTYNLAYGINAVTLVGLTTEDKYVLQVWDKTGTTKLADVRQSPNAQTYAEFDIENILQSYVAPSAGNIETTSQWHDSDEEVLEYQLKYGSETDGVIDGNPALEPDQRLTTLTGFKVLGGRKAYYQLGWSEAAYKATVSQDGESPCTQIDGAGKPLTDWDYYILGSQIDQQEPPAGLGASDRVYVQKVRPSDNFTLSILQELEFGAIAPISQAKGVEAYRIVEYDRFDTRISDTIVPNVTSYGGGPNNTPYQGNAIVDPYWVVTAGVGPRQLLLNPLTSYYYIGFPVATDGICTTEHTNYTDESAFHWWKFEITDDKCNDFTPIQFSWMNSLGFRDYFYFEKRNEKQLNISRNNYLAEANNFNNSTFTTGRTDRGFTTYSQTIEETYVANTRFLQDYEAAFLENLFISPDVKVRFGDDTEWFPVTLLTTSYTERNYRKDKLFQYEISFKKAHNIKSQRG